MSTSSEMKTLYLHLGYYKAASTFLQKKVFPKYSDSLNFLSLPNFEILEDEVWVRSSMRRFAGRSPLVWRRFGHEFFESAFASAGVDSRKKSLLISDENSLFRLRKRIAGPDTTVRHIEELERQALKYFSSIKILLVIRRQDTWLASAYAQICSSPKQQWSENPSQQHFAEWTDSQTSKRKRYYSGFGSNIEYLYLIKNIIKNNIDLTVLPFELLKENKKKFLSEIASFLDQDYVEIGSEKRENVKSTSANTWRISKRRKITLRPSRLFNKIGLSKIDLPNQNISIKLTKKISNNIMKSYKKTNKEVSYLIGKDLIKYGYF